MILPFLNRDDEKKRLIRLIENGGGFAVVYGRRRCGKSRLIREILPKESSVYYVGDEREAPLQRDAFSKEVARLVHGFDQVIYPDWGSLFDRWWNEAPSKSCLCIDEFPYLVQVSPEIPSLLQKLIDQCTPESPSLILSGSSQTMMHGLVLDSSAPLYGRAREVLRIKPLGPSYLPQAFSSDCAEEALFTYMLWGGVPRYWELAKDFPNQTEAYDQLVLDPLGPLYAESERLLHEDVRDPMQAISILSLIGSGCHRPSEIAGRLGKPLTSIVRPLNKLIDLQLIEKGIPFLANPKTNKHVVYKIEDPFKSMWYEHVLPHRSLLELGMNEVVKNKIMSHCNARKADIWESLAREALPKLNIADECCLPAQRWWGKTTQQQKIELDIVSETIDKKTLIVGEVKLNITANQVERYKYELERKANALPFRASYQKLEVILFSASPCASDSCKVFDARDIFTINS